MTVTEEEGEIPLPFSPHIHTSHSDIFTQTTQQLTNRITMKGSKISGSAGVALSPAVKKLIAARGAPVPAPATGELAASRQLGVLLDRLQAQTSSRGSDGLSSPLPRSVLLTLATGTFVTLNSPSALRGLWQWSGKQAADATLMREAGLKCISFIGIAKVINNLGVLHDCFVKDGVQAQLSADSRRDMWAESANPTFHRGSELWNSIYTPHSDKLIDKLAAYHPDLPVHILESHYSLLLSDPSPVGPLGRTLTSVLAIACLQAQTGVGGQTTSHVFGLKKALSAEPSQLDKDGRDEEGLTRADKEWLCNDAGNEWALESIEALRTFVSSEGGAVRAKL